MEVMEGLSEEVTLKQRFEWGTGDSHRQVWERAFQTEGVTGWGKDLKATRA